MRLHTAVTFLAQSYWLPWSSDALAFGDKKLKRKRQLFLQQKRQTEKGYYVDGQKKKDIPLKEALPGNVALAQVEASQPADAPELKECQPAPEEALDSVFGFLAGCGPDEECVESELSKTGGICVKTTDQLYKRKMQRRAQYSDGLCANPTCDCTNFDQATYVGNIVCTYDTYCVTSNGIEYCYVPNYTYSYSGNQASDSDTKCFEFSSGPLDSFCYTITYDGGCEFDVNGVTCSSCLIATCPADSEIVSGFIWDCSGTTLEDLGTATGSYCDGDVFLPFLGDAAPVAPAAPATAVPVSPTAPTAPATAVPVSPTAPTAPITTEAPVTPAPVTSVPVSPTAPATAVPVSPTAPTAPVTTEAPVTPDPVSTPAPVPGMPTPAPVTPPPTTSAASTTKTALVSAVAVAVGGAVAAAVAMA